MKQLLCTKKDCTEKLANKDQTWIWILETDIMQASKTVIVFSHLALSAFVKQRCSEIKFFSFQKACWHDY